MSHFVDIADGRLIEITPVRDNEPELKKRIVADVIAVSANVWYSRINTKKPKGISDYDQVVNLLGTFWAYVHKVETEVKCDHIIFEAQCYDGNKQIDWKCKARTHVEDGVRCLTFTEVI